MHVYVITNTVNDKIYVGQTSKDNLSTYFRQKMSKAVARRKSSRIPLYGALLKYGVGAFVVESIVRPTSKEQMDELEKFFIRVLDSRNSDIGYNVTAGGEGTLGVKRSPEQKAGMRERMIANKLCQGRTPSSPRHIAALAANSFATKTPDEFSALHELAKEARRKASWTISEAARQKSSSTQKGVKKSEETKRRMRDAFLQRTTPEQRRTMSRVANETRWNHLINGDSEHAHRPQ